MAMTNALNYVTEKSFSEWLIYQMINRTVSSPRPLFSLFDRTTASYPLFRPSENFLSFHILKKTSDIITTREQLMLISAFFGFSKSKLGELFGVARQSIYNWFNNSEVTSEHIKKIKRMAEIVLEIDPEPSQQLFHIYTNDVIKGYDKSLFNYLLDDNFDKDTVVALSRTIYEMSRERWKRIDAMPKVQYR